MKPKPNTITWRRKPEVHKSKVLEAGLKKK